MASLTAHAITIETDAGDGNPVSYTNADIGVSAGVFYLITDRFGLDGSKTIAGDTSRTTWYEGILTKDYSSYSPSRTADLVESGDISASSSLQFSIKNTSDFWSTIEANAIYLARCRVTYFYVTSEDGEEFTFTRRWTGIIEEQPFTETQFQIRCIDNSKDIFTSLPSGAVNNAAYPDAVDSDKAIPIAVGRIAQTPLVNINRSEEKIVLAITDGIGRTISVSILSAPTATGSSLLLATNGVTFLADDSRLVGSFITRVSGGTAQSIKIMGNDATASGLQATFVFLLEAFDGGVVDWSSSLHDDTVNYFEVSKYNSTLIASQKEIYSIQDGPTNSYGMSAWSDSEKEFIDVSELVEEVATDNIDFSGFPGLRIASDSRGEGNIGAYFGIVATDVTVDNEVSAIHSAGTGDIPEFHDRNPDTYEVFDIVGVGGGSFDLTLTFPVSDISKDFDALYILPDFDHKLDTSSASVTLYRTVLVEDLFGREVTVLSRAAFTTGTIPTTYTAFDTLPEQYYGITGIVQGFFSEKADFDITEIIDSVKKTRVYPRIKFRFEASWSGLRTYHVRIKEIGIVGKKTVSTNDGGLYSAIQGEVFGTGWRDPFESPTPGTTNRKTAANPICFIGDALEHLIRNYDYNHPVWLAEYAYAVGERVRSTVDNGFIYICTVAGTSDASEPTFPTTLEDTVSDGSVTWKALDTLKIHCGSFDTLAAQRFNWPIGRTLIEKKPSLDYYRELARHGMFGILIDAHGRVKVKSWTDNRTPSVTFSSSNILAGSLGEMSLTSMRRVYNDFTIRYAWNPGSKSFSKQITVTNVDAPAFPGANEYVGAGTILNLDFIGLAPGGDGTYTFVIYTTTPHGLEVGNYVSMQGNADGYDFPPTPVIGVSGATTIIVVGHLTATSPSSSGTLRRNDVGLAKWKTFVGGVQSYGSARGLWEQCHASYLVSKTVQKLPEALGDCHWFIDPDATDPSGNPIWTDLAGAGDEHPAFYYAMKLADWVTWQKKQITFEVPKDSTNMALELYDPVYLNDAKLTGGVDKLGWLHEVVDIGGSERQPDRIRMGVTFNPDQLASCDFIYDTQNAADTVTDTAGATDTIQDQQC